MKNPIIENRVVSDITFAVRNLSFLMNLFPNLSSQIMMEEYEYLVSTACKLLKYQIETCTDSEKWYFNNLVKGYKSVHDILKYICKDDYNKYKFVKQFV